MSEESQLQISLHFDVLYNIMFSGLKTRDVLHCMQVCKSWKNQLSDRVFWKEYVKKNFDLTVESDVEKLEGPIYQWAKSNIWACYFEHHDEEDAYVIRPFPSMWKCGVVVPDGLDPPSFDTKHLQGLCRSLEILVHVRKGTKEFGLVCGSECTGNEGWNELSVVLMPWEGDEIIPNALTIFSKIFQFYQEIWENPQSICSKSFDEKLYFHLDEHPRDERPKRACLNNVFGRPSQNFWKDKEYSYEKELDFFTWLQNIMVPSRRYIAGESKMNPVAEFFITALAPGWVGGILTGETWT